MQFENDRNNVRTLQFNQKCRKVKTQLIHDDQCRRIRLFSSSRSSIHCHEVNWRLRFRASLRVRSIKRVKSCLTSHRFKSYLNIKNRIDREWLSCFEIDLNLLRNFLNNDLDLINNFRYWQSNDVIKFRNRECRRKVNFSIRNHFESDHLRNFIKHRILQTDLKID
jgi:hypothetical protein